MKKAFDDSTGSPAGCTADNVQFRNIVVADATTAKDETCAVVGGRDEDI